MAKKHRILIVEKDPETRTALEEHLAGLGYEVASADGAEDASELFAPGEFDCLICSLDLPEMEGLEFYQNVRLQDKEVAFLVTTEPGRADKALRAMHEGVYDYLTEPIRLEEAALRIERALKAKRMAESMTKLKGLFLSLIVIIPVLVGMGIIFGILWRGVR